MTETEHLQQILTAVGGNIEDLPDNLKSTLYTAIILKCGGTVDDLPDRLETTYLKRIAECVSGGGGGNHASKSAAIKALVDLRGDADYLFENIPRYKDEAFLELFDFNVTENSTTFNNMFMSAHVVCIPPFNISKATGLRNTFRMAIKLEHAPFLDTKHIQDFNCVVNQCASLHTVPEWDVRNGTDFFGAFNACVNLTEIWWKNIKTSLQVGSGSTWGHLLTVESLIHLIKELRDTGVGKTLTIGNVNLDKLANVYVRTVEITDEMRAEDDLIDEKLPFEVCESTDEGAMLIADYVLFKNWEIN